jgi:nicotinamidase-related amidase
VSAPETDPNQPAVPFDPGEAARTPTEDCPISGGALHLCLDMQNLIGPDGPWAARWAERVLPAVVALVEHAPKRTIFTRFIPPREIPRAGAWHDFYQKWAGLTQEHIQPGLLELMPPLGMFTPPAAVFDKMHFSAFSAAGLVERLRAMQADTLVLSGAESDMCVLATALAGIDLGFRIVVATDAICSASDPCHNAVQRLYNERYSAQIRTLPVADIRERWRPAV